MMASGRGGVSRVLSKLQKNVDEGNYYEAHQMYRTLYFRYNTQKKYAEAIDLLYNGSLTLLKHNQHTSGADLALLLIQTLEKANFPASEDIFEKIANLHRLIPGELPEKPNYVRSALQWSGQNCPDNKIGHPLLYQKFALNLWKEKNYPKSRYMFLRSVDGEACANMLVEFHVTSGYPSEVDLFIAQAVLQYLCLRNKTTAEVCFNNYTKKHPQVEGGPPFVRPLLNFLWLLLLAVEGGKVAVFTVLCENYQTSLKRDPNYRDYLDKIGQLFFGVPPPKSTGGGLLGNLLQSLLGVEDDEDESGEGAAMSRPHNNMRSDDLD